MPTSQHLCFSSWIIAMRCLHVCRIVWFGAMTFINMTWMSNLHKKGFITHSDIIAVSDIQPYNIIVLDDLIHESKNSSDVTSMFTRATHYKPCFIIFIMHNLFPSGCEARTRSLNTYYCCIFKNPRDKSQVEFLAWQILPHNPKALIEVFEATTEKPHSYLFLDLTQECPEQFRFRSNLFDKPMIIYQVAKQCFNVSLLLSKKSICS